MVGRRRRFAGGRYVANAVDLDGSSDFYDSNGLTGVTSSQVGFVSIWFKIDGGNGAQLIILGSTKLGASRFLVYRWTDDKFVVIGMDVNSLPRLKLVSSITFLAGGGWHNLLASWDLANGNGWLRIDDVDRLAASPDLQPAFIDHIGADDWTIGAFSGGGAAPWNGCLADVQFDTTTFFDLDVQANRRLFYSSAGKPVRPSGNFQAIFDGDETNFETNSGTGGNLTKNGSPAACSDGPSGL